MTTNAPMPDEKPARPGAPPPSPAPESEPPHRSRKWVWIGAAVVVAIVIAILVSRSSSSKKQATATAAKSAANRAIPVVAAKARVGDIGVYLTGLGTVTALNTVTVRSRVDGQLVRVAFQEGQLVQAGDLLAELDPRPFQVQLMQAEGQKAKDEAALKNAVLDLQRYQALIQQDAIPRQQLDTQASTVNQFQAAVKTDEGQVESAKLNLAYCRIAAPLTGRVGLRLVDAGNIVHATDVNGIVVITQLQPIAVLFTIPADQLPPVQQQLRAGKKLAVEAWDRDLKAKLATGTFLALDNQIDTSTGTVRIKAIFPNELSALYSNQFVNARLLVDTLHGVVLVPTAAIQRSPQSTFVWAVKPDSTVEMRNIDVQLTEGDVVAIRKGVANGDSVVIDGVDKLQPGSKVAPTANESAARAGNAAPAPAPSAAKAGRGRKATS
jgi:membrane fusion protein, multidrug efflux system